MPTENTEPVMESEETPVADMETAPVEEERTSGPDWKALSRKHEDREKSLNAKLGKLQTSFDEQTAELQKARRESAILRAQKTHPALTDEMFEFCTESDPEAIASWAERVVKTFGVGTGMAAAPVVTAEPEKKEPYGDSQHLSEKLARSDNSAGKPADPTSRESAYKRAMERQRQRQVKK
ncbi:hypothetical protein [Bifidobacterium magnum]|uniref:Putative phage protein gp5 n=1 Tax=Bifidobacterium magnum TaxID=1692 RepID=A0A087B686_9BIFI|nr:hypothetical protein [Bifidobacterium magnum]KFI66536.1 putative phage protein gp5 [Bifidobacterium magnum]